MVGLDGLEPSTSRLSGVRSNHLSYKPYSIKAFDLTIFTGKRNGDGDELYCCDYI